MLHPIPECYQNKPQHILVKYLKKTIVDEKSNLHLRKLMHTQMCLYATPKSIYSYMK
jgi:hypothetical protein